MKKILAAVFAVFLLGTFSFAEGTLKADDFDQSESITEKVEAKGFTLHASKENDVRVKASKKVAPDGTSFTQRIELRGKYKGGVRMITFSAKKGEKITVYANSSSKTEDRGVSIQTTKGKTVKSFTAKINTGDVTIGEVEAPEDGEYRVCSTAGAVYIYGITVK